MSAYNDRDRVEQAIASVLEQTFRDLELIVVNDGSSDGSAELLDRLAASDARMRVIHQDNAGLTRALIRACGEARGEFIARQDADDWSYPERITEQLALIESDERIGFVSCATLYVGPAGEPLMTVSRPQDPRIATAGLLRDRQGPPAHGSVMFRRALYLQVGGYRDQFHFSQDSDLWLRMAELAWVACLPEVRYIALKEVASISGVQRPTQKRFGHLSEACSLARREGRSEEPHLHDANRLAAHVRLGGGACAGTRADSDAAAYLLGSQLTRNGDPRGRTYLWQVLRSQPWHWKAWIRMGQSLLSPRRGG
jgi:glycosyltransferase involved in cell wall biosynthesis